MKTIKRKDTHTLFALVNGGKRLIPVGSELKDGTTWQYIDKRYVRNARYNEDQTDVLPGYVISYNHYGSSAIQPDYESFLWLIETIFKDTEEFRFEDKEDII